MTRILVLNDQLADQFIADRQRLGHDRHDEVWDGVYHMPPLANNPHQRLVLDSCMILNHVLPASRGQVFAGANVSDRRVEWTLNFRCPDVVVVLEGGIAVDRGTHWQGGPDFLIEVESPGDETWDKIPFYEQVQVRELLIIHRDTRELHLLRHNGTSLVAVTPEKIGRHYWLRSAVVPLAFRRIGGGRRPARTVVMRTDGQPGQWTI